MPTVQSVGPTNGPVPGGTLVTITGTNFSGATAVDFGTTPATNVTVVSATQITATSPAGTAGMVDMTVVTPGGTSATTSADEFIYMPVASVVGLTRPRRLPTLAQSTGSSFASQTAGTLASFAGLKNVLVGDFTGNGQDDIVGMSSTGDAWYVAVPNATGTSFTVSTWLTTSLQHKLDERPCRRLQRRRQGRHRGHGQHRQLVRGALDGHEFCHAGRMGPWTTTASPGPHVVVGHFAGSSQDDIAGMANGGAWYVAVPNAASSPTGFNTTVVGHVEQCRHLDERGGRQLYRLFRQWPGRHRGHGQRRLVRGGPQRDLQSHRFQHELVGRVEQRRRLDGCGGRRL